MSQVLKITTRNARFQQWHSLLVNRNKRQRLGAFVVQGVRPITIALDQGWAVESVLFDADRQLSEWARNVLKMAGGERFAVSRELLAELGEKADDAPELLAICTLPDDDLGRIAVAHDFLGVAFDRPTSPGNLGSVIRSADSFGAAGVIVTGHGADPYDSNAVRASTGSLFAVPTVRVSSPRTVRDWVEYHRAAGLPIQILGTDEKGDADIYDVDLTLPDTAHRRKRDDRPEHGMARRRRPTDTHPHDRLGQFPQRCQRGVRRALRGHATAPASASGVAPRAGRTACHVGCRPGR